MNASQFDLAEVLFDAMTALVAGDNPAPALAALPPAVDRKALANELFDLIVSTVDMGVNPGPSVLAIASRLTGF